MQKSRPKIGNAISAVHMDNNNDVIEMDFLVDAENMAINDEKKQEYMLFFKTCLLPRDLGRLENALKATIAFRRQLCREKKNEFEQMFPFFFAHPDLVSKIGSAYCIASMIVSFPSFCSILIFNSRILMETHW